MARRPARRNRHAALDWRLERWFGFGPNGKYRLAASFDVFNALNNGLVLEQVDRQNASNANDIETVLAPRVAHIRPARSLAPAVLRSPTALARARSTALAAGHSH